MARVTVEDCIDKVDNRFDLVLLAAHRARMISSGSQLTIDRDNDKNPVVSLRCTTGYRLPSLWLGEIDTTDGNMRFIKIKLALMG